MPAAEAMPIPSPVGVVAGMSIQLSADSEGTVTIFARR